MTDQERITVLTQEVQRLRGVIVGVVAGELTGGEALAALVAYRLPEDAREGAS